MLRHFERERLIWDSPLLPEQKLALLAIAHSLKIDNFLPLPEAVAEMTGCSLGAAVRHLEMFNEIGAGE